MNKQIPQYPSGSLIEQRRDFILYMVAQDPGLLTDDVIEELAELEGSDTSAQTQLFDSGFGLDGRF